MATVLGKWIGGTYFSSVGGKGHSEDRRVRLQSIGLGEIYVKNIIKHGDNVEDTKAMLDFFRPTGLYVQI